MSKKSSNARKKFISLLGRAFIYGVVLVLLLFSTIQLSRQTVLLEKVNQDNSQLIQEFGQVKAGVIQFGNDLNEMRDYLLLPTREYDFFPKTDSKPDAEQLALGVYRFVDFVGKDYVLEQDKKSSYEAIKALKKDRSFLNELGALKLFPAIYLEETADIVKFKFYENKTTPVVNLVLNRPTAAFYMESILGLIPLEIKAGESLNQGTLNYLKGNRETIINVRQKLTEQKEAMKALWQTEEASLILKAKKLQVNLNPSEVEKGFEYIIYNAATQPLLSVWIDRKTAALRLGENTYNSVEDLRHDLLTELDQLEGETDFEKAIQTNREKLNQLINEPAFAEALAISHLNLLPEREEAGRLYFDLVNLDDEKKVGSIIFEALTGDLKFWRADDNREYDLEDVFDFGEKKN